MRVKSLSILGCGWLGLPLAKHFIANGFHINGSTRTVEKCGLLESCGIKPFLLDLSHKDAKVYADFLSDSKVVIINIPPGRAPNVIKTYSERILNIVSYISSCQKVLFISSTSVYQNTNTEVLENLKLEPEKNTGKAILAVEQLLQKILEDRLTIIRFAGLVGYDRQPGRFLANRKGLTTGNMPVNIIHRDDCIGLIEAVLVKEIWGEIINGCADKHPLKKDFYRLAAKKIGLTPPEFIENATSNFKIVSNAKSKELVGYKYKYPNPMTLVTSEP